MAFSKIIQLAVIQIKDVLILPKALKKGEDGRFSSVGSLTSPSMLSSPRYIRRTNKSVSHTLTMELEAGREEEAKKAIEI